MACNLLKDKVGYKGQRYEVRFTDEEGVERVFGWQNENSLGLVEAANLHPGWSEVHVVDLCTCKIDKTRRKQHLASCEIEKRKQAA